MRQNSGFTLIELSIVLVIIGLIVGGILVGRDLINAAATRAQLSQIQSYQAAVNTFRGKYGYLPGDIKGPDATQFGFVARGQYDGQGDGNGVIMGNNNGNAPGSSGIESLGTGEQLMFWVDLSQAHLIGDSFLQGATPTTILSGVKQGTAIASYVPKAKLGDGMYVLLWANSSSDGCTTFAPCEQNYFGLQSIQYINSGRPHGGAFPGVTVAQAGSIDAKVDDGLPLSGKVLAIDINLTTDSDYGVYPSTAYSFSTGFLAGG